MKIIQQFLVILIAISIGYIIGSTPSVEQICTESYNQQNVKISDLKNLSSVPTPTPDIISQFQILHIDNSTTSFRMITFSTTTNVGGYYAHADGSVNMRVYNWQRIKRLGEEPKDVPIISMSTLVHELVHMTTLYNTRGEECRFINDSICQEKMAYDAGFYYEQVRSLEQDGHIVISKD